MRTIVKRLFRAAGLEVKRRGQKAKGPASQGSKSGSKTKGKSTKASTKPPEKKENAAPKKPNFPRDFDADRQRLCEAVRPYTMTNVEKLGAAMDAVEYVAKNGIEGAIVECGVWKGGSSMAMAMTLLRLRAQPRDLYLYDTFSGMPAPTDKDISVHGKMASEKFAQTQIAEDASEWARSPLDEVKANMLSTGYPAELCHFVQGKVEETIPGTIPDKIAVLRLDTDWYESTKHEMVHLFPRLSPGGVLIVDDYGHWLGSKKAVDEYISEMGLRILLSRIDYSCRMAVKL